MKFKALKGEKDRVRVVPARLPWKLVRNLTRCIQVVWLFAGVMFFLRDRNLVTVDDFCWPEESGEMVCKADEGLDNELGDSGDILLRLLSQEGIGPAARRLQQKPRR